MAVTRGAVTLSDLLAGVEANSAKGNNQAEKLSNFKESYAAHRQEVINNVENRESANASPLPAVEQNNEIQSPTPDTSTKEKPEAKKEPSYVTNNILFEQWKEGFDKRREEKNAEKREELLQKKLDELNQNAAYISTTAASDEYEQERKDILNQLHALDEAAGRENRSYDGRERADAFFGSWGKGTGASYTNAAANLIDVGNEVGSNAKGAERELADLEAQLARAQTAYQEAVREYGEAGATLERNLLADAQQKYDAKKALYATTEGRDRAAYEKTKATVANMYDVADMLLTQSEQDMQKAKYGTSAVGSFALDAAKTGLDIGLDTAISALGVPGLANMAARVYGSETQQARLQGDDAQTAAAKGLKSALIEVVTEKIAGPFEKAYGKTALSSSINKAVDKLNASGLLKWAVDTAGEGFEEGMSDVLNTVADHMMGWDSGENSVLGDIAANKDEIVYDMLLGAFVGAFGATGNAIGAKANTTPTAQAQPQVEQTAPVQTAPTQAETSQQAAPAVQATQTNPVDASQGAKDNLTPPTAQNVEQGDSGALNNAVNYNGRETQTAAARKAALDERISRFMARVDAEGQDPNVQTALSAEAEAIDAEERAINALETQEQRVSAGEVSRQFNTPENHIDNRNFGDVANRNTKAFQFDHPELHEYYTGAAQELFSELQNALDTDFVRIGQKGARSYNRAINRLVNSGMTKPRIMQCLNDIINNNGAENYADAKRVEIVLDDMLTNGWLDMARNSHPANEAYIAAKEKIAGAADRNSWEKFLAEHEASVFTGLVTEEQLRQEWESKNPQKNTAPTQETGNVKDTSNEVVAKLKNSIPAIQQEPIVATLNGNEFAKGEKKLTEQVGDFFKSFGNKVFRSGLGNVILDERGVKSDIAHGLGRAKSLTFAAVPDVIATGKQIDFQENWKGRGYDSYIFAAPVIIGDQTSYVAAVVLSDSNNRFYLHEVVDENGNMIYSTKKVPSTSRPGSPQNGITGVEETSSATPMFATDGTSALSGGLETVANKGVTNTVSNDISSDTSIRTDTQNVKQNFEGEETEYRSNLGKGNGTRTTQTVETINNADITTDARREQLSPYVKNGKFDYIPDTNKAQTERATRSIARNGWSESAKDFHDAVIKGKSGKDLVARGAVLLNNASNSNANAGEYLDLVSDYIELLHRAGETLQAGKILQQLTPEGRLYCMQKTVKQINNSLTKGQHKAIAKAQEGKNYKNANIKETYMDYGVKLDENLADEYMKAETDEQRDAVISQIQQNIADQIPSTFVDKWNALRYVNMLGNFKTQVRNVGGNALMLATSASKNRVKAAAEATANLFRAEDNQIERTASFIVGGKLRKEAAADFENIKDIARGEGKYNDAQRFGKELQDKRTIFKINGDWGKSADGDFAAAGLRKAADVSMKVLEGYRNLTNKAMDVGDVVFLKATYADALGGWLKAHGIKSISDATPEQLERGRAYAIKEAQEATFRDDNIVSKTVSKIGRNPITEGIMPFRKTPANVAVRALEYSPVGVAETVYKAFQTKNGNANANDVINSLSKNIVGSILASAGYFLAKAGIARGTEDDDDLDQFQKMQGKQDYAVKIGDEWISLSQLAPNSVPLYMGVKLYELLDGGSLSFEDMSQILGVLSDPLMDMSMLSGINDALADVVTYGNDSDLIWKVLENAALSYLTQGINNSIIGQIEQASEENRQTVYSDKDSPLSSNAQYKLGKALGKIPGVDYQQQDYIDAWGRTQSNGSTGERVFDAFLNPVYTSKSDTTKVDSELERLYKAGKNVEGFPNVLPSKASRSTEYVKGQTLTPDEYKQYSIDRGQKSLELVSDFVESKEYKQLSDQQRAEVISDLYSLAATQAMNKVKTANGVAQTDLSKYKGISDKEIPQYLATKQVLNDAKNGKTTDWSGVDALLANIKSYSPEVQEKLQTSSGLNVNKLLYADNLGIDSKAWYKAHNAVKKNQEATGSSKDWVTAEAIDKLGGSNEDKLARLSAEIPPDGTTYNRVRGGYTRPSIIRRYDAAIKSGVDFDVWTDVEKIVEQLQNGNNDGWQCSKKFITQALADNGYTQKQIDDVWAIKNATGDYEGVNYLDDYWGQLIENAGKAAAGK